jgi:tripartite-type tricarboxylate transporter receptor subunit TctC
MKNKPPHRPARRALLVLSAALLAAPAWAQPAFPDKPVRLVIGFPAGSSTDVLGRALANKMGELAGQQFIVENRPGAGSNIAAQAVATAPADGTTILLGGVTNAVNVSLTKPAGFDPARDIVPLALVGSIPNIVVVHPDLSVNSVQELIALAKTKPGELQYGSAGNGTSPHLSGELFNLSTGTKLAHIPYKGSNQAVQDLVGGRIAVMFAPASTALPLVRGGKLKALATTGSSRTSAAPELPTVAESGVPGFDTSIWFGLFATRGTPAPAMERLAALAAQAGEAPEVKAQLAGQGIEVLRGGPAEFGRFYQSEIEKWRRVVTTAGIKAE